MRAAIVREFGLIASHSVGEMDDPRPGPDDVLVEIKAVAVNYVDSLVVTGTYQFLPQLPFAPGKLPVGVVREVGARVSDLKIGARVLTLVEQGGYAQKIVVNAKQCFELPHSMSFVDAAAMSLVYDTAWFALRDRARIIPGESVLVLGSTGGVGIAAIQLAKAMDGRVFAAVSDPSKTDLAIKAGADEVINLGVENLRDRLREQVFDKNGGKGVDIVIDPIGGDAFDASIRALAWRGRLVVVGFASGRIPAIKVNYLLLKNIEVTGLQVSDYRKRTPTLMAQAITEIFSMFSAGKLRVGAISKYPLDMFAQALQDIVDRKVRGRAVLIPNPD